MTELANLMDNMNRQLGDLDAMGIYMDSHDFARSLYLLNDWQVQMANYAFVLTARGIPIIYYGGEQGLIGKDDDQSRELMFAHFDR